MAKARAEAIENFKRKTAGRLQSVLQATVQARPGDIPQLEQAKALSRGELDLLVKICFKDDKNLEPGELIIESGFGRLKAAIKNHPSQF